VISELMSESGVFQGANLYSILCSILLDTLGTQMLRAHYLQMQRLQGCIKYFQLVASQSRVASQ